MSTAQGDTVIGYPVEAHQVATANPCSNSDQLRPARPTSYWNKPATIRETAPAIAIVTVLTISFIVIAFLQVHPPNFKVDSGTVTSALNGTTASSSEWDIVLLANNKVSFKTLKALVSYRNHTLELKPSPATPIVLNKKTRQHIKRHVTGGDVGEYIDDDRRSRGFMSFPVIRVRACFRGNIVFYILSERCHWFYCGPVHFVFSHDVTTATSLGQTECYLPVDWHPHS